MRYRTEIDGLRAVAVVPVVLFHAGFGLFGGGFIGVDVFFVLSGYLISGILIEELSRGTFSIAGFYERRARRILPALSFVVLCCLPFAYLWMVPEQMTGFAQSIAAAGLFISNIYFWQESGYFAPDVGELPLLHTWSLAVEEQFYIVFPLLLLVLWRFGRNRVFLVIAVLAGLSFGLSEWGWRQSRDANFFLAPTRAWELLSGSICAFLLEKGRFKENGWWAGVGLGMILTAVFLIDEGTPTPSIYALLPVVGTVLVILMCGPRTWVGRLLSQRLFVGIGLISYSVYLWHQPLFAFARIRLPDAPGAGLMAALCALAIFLGYLSWRFVEQPFRRRSRPEHDSRAKVLTCAASVCAGLVLIGYLGQMDKGLAFRMDAAYESRVKNWQTLSDLRKDELEAHGCNYAGAKTSGGLQAFRAQWPCQVDGVPDPAAVIYGDSHAGDISVALRSAGYKTVSLSANGCPLVQDRFALPYCKPLLETFLEKSRERGIRTVILANDFSQSELSERVMADMISFWTSHFDNVILFSPRPIFPRFRHLYLTRGDAFLQRLSPNLSQSEVFFQSLALLESTERVSVIDSKAVFCQERTPCAPIRDGALLMIDDDHLTLEGHAMFGAAVSDLYGALFERLGIAPCLEDCLQRP